MNRLYIPSFIWGVIVTYLSLAESSTFPTFVFKLPKGSDKVVHFALYFVFIILIIWPLARKRYKKYQSILYPVLCTLFVIFFGILMEVLQKYCTITRSFEINDILADTIGAIAGLFVYKTLLLRLNIFRNE